MKLLTRLLIVLAAAAALAAMKLEPETRVPAREDWPGLTLDWSSIPRDASWGAVFGAHWR